MKIQLDLTKIKRHQLQRTILPHASTRFWFRHKLAAAADLTKGRERSFKATNVFHEITLSSTAHTSLSAAVVFRLLLIYIRPHFWQTFPTLKIRPSQRLGLLMLTYVTCLIVVCFSNFTIGRVLFIYYSHFSHIDDRFCPGKVLHR